jgi:hypothetical protein
MTMVVFTCRWDGTRADGETSCEVAPTGPATNAMRKRRITVR